MEQVQINDTIAAISTPSGVGGIAVIRISGPKAVEVVNSAWKGTDLKNIKSHTVHLGKYISVDGDVIDESVLTFFKAPASFTGEDVIELGIHGSVWIQKEILNDLVHRGVRIANPGEFTQRAFMNGKMDLAQAEGVADLIASSSKAAHDMALNQTKGTFSKEFNLLRDNLIEFASLLELELDFSEEDVEFADRSALLSLCDKVLKKVHSLASSYSRGEVLKNGVPVVIAGVPNAGKSSLLNLLLRDEKAIVTDIPGTTRDIIEDTVEIDGILYRFIDTAGIRETDDKVEGIGVQRAISSMEKAYIIIWVIDAISDIETQWKELNKFRTKNLEKNIILLFNKTDLSPSSEYYSKRYDDSSPILFSTHTSQGYPELLETLNKIVTDGADPAKDIIVSNARHYQTLIKAEESLKRVQEALTMGLSSDLISQELREAISHLSTLTGSITTTDLLHSIFSRFCIGK